MIENAVNHSGPSPIVTVAVDLGPTAVEIRITNNGHGLAEPEAAVVQTGTEEPVTHGSGLVVWLARWIVTSHDGSIHATVTAEGTTITLTVPRAPAGEGTDWLTELRRARDHYQATFEAAQEAMVFLDDESRIIDTNPPAIETYGVKP